MLIATARFRNSSVENRYRCPLCDMLFLSHDHNTDSARCPVCDTNGFFDTEFSNTEVSGIVAYTGSHGVGKTTSMLDKAKTLKLDLPGKTITTLAENVIESPYPINQETTEESQRWIFTNQMQAELKMMSFYDVVVTDRTVLDAVAYTYVAGFDRMAEAMFAMFQCHCHIYDQVYFKTIRKNNYLVSDGLRDASDLDFQRNVETVLLDLYRRAGFKQLVLT